MINNELLEKYNIRTLEEFKVFDGGNVWSEIAFYQTFLIQTDHIPNKIIESLLEEIGSATLLNFIEVFLKFIVTVKTEYKEILNARKYARDKINELKQDELNEDEFEEIIG